MNRLGVVALVVAMGGTAAFAQNVISARAGLIHYVEGDVLLDGKTVEVKVAVFPDMKVGSELRTVEGRAEILLTPGVFLRLGENTAVRMIKNRLSDAQVEFISGSAIVEADADTKQDDDSSTILYKGAAVHLRKSGIYRFDSEPAQLRVYSGEAEVGTGSNVLIVKASKMVALDSAVAVEKFDNKLTDALTRWSRRRAEYVSLAHVSAAKSVFDSGTYWTRGGWYYNPYFGIMSFLPGHGSYRNPYGYMLYSPALVYNLYQPMQQTRNGMNSGFSAASPSVGYRQAPQTSSGYSGVIASTPAPARSAEPSAPAPAPAASAPVSRESGRVGGTR
jgi:hypothetical protein